MEFNDGNRSLQTSHNRAGRSSGKQLDSEYFDAETLRVERYKSQAGITEDVSEYDEEAYQYGFRKPKNTKMRSKPRTKNDHLRIRLIAGTIAGVLGVVAGLLFFVIWYKNYLLNHITYETTAPDAVITIINEEGETVVLNDVTETTQFDVIRNESVKNFLLIGIDSRSKNYNSSGTGDRSDVICIMSIDSRQKTIKLLSIQRDSYAYFPGYEKPHKINAAMAYGGPDLLQATIENCLRIKLDGYAYVNFSHMANIIDAVGGVYVNMTTDEMNVANNYIKEMNSSAALINSTGNDTWLNGIQAVAYARNRYSGNGDYERMERQIEVLRSLMKQYMGLSSTRKLACLDDILSAVVTNIDRKDIEKYAIEFLPAMRDPQMQYLQLVIDGCYNCGMYGGEWSMRCNWNAYVIYVQKYFYGETSRVDEVKVPPYAPELADCKTDIPLDQLIH